jgi:hypothetical protein
MVNWSVPENKKAHFLEPGDLPTCEVLTPESPDGVRNQYFVMAPRDFTTLQCCAHAPLDEPPENIIVLLKTCLLRLPHQMASFERVMARAAVASGHRHVQRLVTTLQCCAHAPLDEQPEHIIVLLKTRLPRLPHQMANFKQAMARTPGEVAPSTSAPAHPSHHPDAPSPCWSRYIGALCPEDFTMRCPRGAAPKGAPGSVNVF